MRTLALWGMAGCTIEVRLHGSDGVETPDVEEPLEPEEPIQPLPEPVDLTLDVAAVARCTTGGFAALVGSTGYDTVDRAVAVSEPGDTVIVCPGTHEDDDGVVSLEHALALVAADPAVGATRLRFSLDIVGPGSVTIGGFTVMPVFQDAIRAEDGPERGPLQVTGSVIELASAPGVIGIWTGVSTRIHDTRIVGGAGVSMVTRADRSLAIDVADTLFAGGHGGIQVEAPGVLQLTDVGFEDLGHCGAIVVTLGAVDFLASTPVDVAIVRGRFVRTSSAPSFAYPIGAAVSFRVEDMFRCTDCEWVDNEPHDVARDDQAFDQLGPDVEL